MMNSDGTGEPTILYKVDVMHDEIIPIKCPCFSPDGNYVYVNYGPENTRWQICKQPVKGGNLRGVVGPPGDYSYSGSGNFGIAVSNSLKMIAAVWSVPFDNPIGLDLMGMDGSNRRNLYTLPADSSIPPGVEYGPPSFSPSGKTIAFSARDGRIFLISTNGGKPKEVILDGVQPCFGREPVGESQQSAK
jgi:Tol biopolymer transport system component